MIALLLPWHINLTTSTPAVHHDAPEERAMMVATEPRAFAVLESRVLAVEDESRSPDVAAELRALAVEAENRRLS